MICMDWKDSINVGVGARWAQSSELNRYHYQFSNHPTKVSLQVRSAMDRYGHGAYWIIAKQCKVCYSKKHQNVLDEKHWAAASLLGMHSIVSNMWEVLDCNMKIIPPFIATSLGEHVRHCVESDHSGCFFLAFQTQTGDSWHFET